MAYSQHGDMICCKSVSSEYKKIRKPWQRMFKKINVGDKIVYYAAGSYAIVGIFEITSGMEFFSDDVWNKVFTYKIKPFKMPMTGHYLHIKKLLFDSDYEFDMFPNKHLWHTALRGKTMKSLSPPDYEIFLNSLDNQKYLIRKEDTKVPVTVWQRKMGHHQSTV